MLKIIIALFMLLQINAVQAASSVLSVEDKNQVLEMIDRVCADTWCAGDFDYKFTSIFCNDSSKVCTLSFTIIDRDEHNRSKKEVNRRCLFKGIKSKESIFTGDKLNEEFYDQLNECITDRESKN